jgi:hypothetical protein
MVATAKAGGTFHQSTKRVSRRKDGGGNGKKDGSYGNSNSISCRDGNLLEAEMAATRAAVMATKTTGYGACVGGPKSNAY